jgi:hypothetical protein
MHKCPKCERPFKRIWDYPYVKILKLEKRELPSDLSVTIHDNSPEPTADVEQAFELDKPAKYDDRVWQIIRHGDWNWKRIFSGDPDRHELVVHLNIDGDNVATICHCETDMLGLKNYLQHNKDGIPLTNFKIANGGVFMYMNDGWKRLDALDFMTKEQIDGFNDLLNQGHNITLTRIEEKSRFVYYRSREDGLSTLLPPVNQYLKRLEDLIGKEVATHTLNINPEIPIDAFTKWDIPNSHGFRLSFEEVSEFDVGCLPGTAYITITHNDYSSGFNIDSSSGKLKLVPSKEEGKNSSVLVAIMDYEGLLKP